MVEDLDNALVGATMGHLNKDIIMDRETLNELIDQGYTEAEARAELRWRERQQAKARKPAVRPDRYDMNDAFMNGQYD